MTNKERKDAISFFKEVAEKEVNNAKYSKLAIEALEQKHQTIGHPHITNVNELFPKMHELNQVIFDKGYKDGLNDAWKYAKKIVGDVVEPNFESGYMVDIFRCESAITAMKNNSPSEAIAKIKEYEEKQKQANDEIKVGDEVIDGEVFNSGKGIVTFASPLLLYVLWYDGSTGKRKLEDIKKTGRHFDQIAEALEQLKEEEK